MRNSPRRTGTSLRKGDRVRVVTGTGTYRNGHTATVTGPVRLIADLDVLVRFDDDNRREYGYSAVDLELIYP